MIIVEENYDYCVLQVEVSATGRSLVQRNPTVSVRICVCLYVRARVRVRIFVFVCACTRVCARVCVCVIECYQGQ